MMLKKKKVLFLIHDLGQGGAEKVLVNLVNNLDRNSFDISVTALFGGGVNESFLKPDVHYSAVFPRMIPANSKWMKLLSPRQLHRMCVKEHYDIEISYLEGPSARVISGCEDSGTKTVCWIHSTQSTMGDVALPFRSRAEAVDCYTAFDRIVCVSEYVRESFCRHLPVKAKSTVVYNTLETDEIRKLAEEDVPELNGSGVFTLIGVGTLKKVKGFDRLIRIVKRLKEDGYPIRLLILGQGPLEGEIKTQIAESGLQDVVLLLGYQINPYKYLANSDLFVCSSYSEGFSTAATEALIVGTPVITVDVSGMRELLGEDGRYGLITENEEESLCQGVKRILDDENLYDYYKKQTSIRGAMFSKQETVTEVEELLKGLCDEGKTNNLGDCPRI